MPYRPIEHYGIIGDLQSVALVSKDGSIDWCCLPRFDSPSLFAAILDDTKGGYFRIYANHDAATRQMYLPDTNVLLTRFLSHDGVGEITDFMPIRRSQGGLTEHHGRQIVRTVGAVRGHVRFRLELFPAFNYGRDSHNVELCRGGAVFSSAASQFVLTSPIELKLEGTGLVADFELNPNETLTFALRYRDGAECRDLVTEPLDAPALLTDTVRYWRNWMRHCKYTGRWREMVHRSALVLKLLTYQPTGAVVAAPTASLPESMGGPRNWDYRYTWVRDAAFTVYALMRLGYTEEAAAFMQFMQARAQEEEQEGGPLNVMYGIDGRHDLPEFTLDHFEGYRGSNPVRIGNAAVKHLQLDIYGELMDSIYLYDKYGAPLSYDMWREVESMLGWLCKNWDQPDQSIWEVRGGRQQFVYSKLQSWVALDRGLRLGAKRSFPMDGDAWRHERDRIYRAIMTEGWNERLQSFVQFYDSDAVDASALMMPLMLFISPTDPRMLSTLDRIEKDLVSDTLVYRYDVDKAARDGLPGGEGTFSMCTFWLVEALTRSGKLESAQFVFEKMLTYANHLGLFSEQIGPSGEALGNFPQAFTHLGLISAAFNLDRRLGAV